MRTRGGWVFGWGSGLQEQSLSEFSVWSDGDCSGLVLSWGSKSQKPTVSNSWQTGPSVTNHKEGIAKCTDQCGGQMLMDRPLAQPLCQRRWFKYSLCYTSFLLHTFIRTVNCCDDSTYCILHYCCCCCLYTLSHVIVRIMMCGDPALVIVKPQRINDQLIMIKPCCAKHTM